MKKCPLKKCSNGDIIALNNYDISVADFEEIKRTGAIKIQSDEPPSISPIMGNCDKEACAWWYENQRECALLSLAKKK